MKCEQRSCKLRERKLMRATTEPTEQDLIFRLELELIHYRNTKRGKEFLRKALNDLLGKITNTTTVFKGQ
jgi:hypothetical protein